MGHRGSVELMLNESGNFKALHSCNAWGERLQSINIGAPYRFGYQSNWAGLGTRWER